ncbi:MAG: dihydroorotate dehydrogenase electron transfer subunit [Bacillota bacterium]|nr:dihydroorotate dehydrogenase electron transfer subunit [Bacillota bacterium]
MNKYQKGQIISNEPIGSGVYLIKIAGSYQGDPGQFYMLRDWQTDPILSRPLGIVDIEEDSISFLYMVVGRGTDHFSKKKAGEYLELLGPLGKGFDLGDHKKVALASGAAGLAPMLYLAKKLNCQVDLYAGFRDYDFFLDAFKDHVDNIYISSDNGKVGFHGNVLQLMEEKGQDYDMVFACGPMPMLRAMAANLDQDKLQVSLEARMACGFGVCLGCAVETTQGIQRVCHDGPVFYASEVVF